jgi:hypothetical protein
LHGKSYIYLNIPVVVGSSLSDKYERVYIFYLVTYVVPAMCNSGKSCAGTVKDNDNAKHTSNKAIWSSEDHLFFQSLTEICCRFCLQSKLNCGIQAHFGWLGQEAHTLKQWILVSILVSQSADSVYCVLPIVDLGPAEIFS